MQKGSKKSTSSKCCASYDGVPAEEIAAGKADGYFDHIEWVYGAAFRSGSVDAIETFCLLHRQIADIGNKESTDRFGERFVPMLPSKARRMIINEYLNKPPTGRKM